MGMNHEKGKWYWVDCEQNNTGIARFKEYGLIWKEKAFISSELYTSEGEANLDRGSF
jgi:hypothetical protein